MDPGQTAEGEHTTSAVNPTMGVADVRRHHLSVVLDHLVRSGPRSRASLAQEIGLTKATVSALVADLGERGLVHELETPRDGRRGRPAVDVAAAGQAIAGLGLEIDVDRVAAVLVDLTGEVRARSTRTGDNRTIPSATVIDRLRQVAHEAMAEAAEAGIECVGATLAVPGLVDPATRTLFVAPNLHWFDADLGEAIEHLALPAELEVTVDNEANLAALAEARLGAGADLSSFVYVSGGIGIGAGIVLDGQLARGTHGFAGEIGHLVVDPLGNRCSCGARGCLETIAGADVDADREQIAEALSAALRSVVHIVDPDAVLLGGTFAELGEPFVAAVGERLHAATLGARWSPCEVRAAALGIDATLIGAATVALDRVVADPTLVSLNSAGTPSTNRPSTS